jgi:hypothetical protein
MNRTGISIALLSATLFGASTPFAKLLLGSVDPWMLAGILYLGAGFGFGGRNLVAGCNATSQGGSTAAAF